MAMFDRAVALYRRNLFGKWQSRNRLKWIPHEGKREVARRERQIARGLIHPIWEGEL